MATEAVAAPAYPRCGNCAFWKLARVDRESRAHHQCRRRAPVAIRRGGEILEVGATWPETVENQWCGDHQPRAPAPA